MKCAQILIFTFSAIMFAAGLIIISLPESHFPHETGIITNVACFSEQCYYTLKNGNFTCDFFVPGEKKFSVGDIIQYSVNEGVCSVYLPDPEDRTLGYILLSSGMVFFTVNLWIYLDTKKAQLSEERTPLAQSA